MNLQGANNIINYDSAWNPMVVEQRIGRVHRIGQRRTVHVYNIKVYEMFIADEFTQDKSCYSRSSKPWFAFLTPRKSSGLLQKFISEKHLIHYTHKRKQKRLRQSQSKCTSIAQDKEKSADKKIRSIQGIRRS